MFALGQRRVEGRLRGAWSPGSSRAGAWTSSIARSTRSTSARFGASEWPRARFLGSSWRGVSRRRRGAAAGASTRTSPRDGRGSSTPRLDPPAVLRARPGSGRGARRALGAGSRAAGLRDARSFTVSGQRERPGDGVLAVTTMLRARTCGSATTAATSLTGPQGIPRVLEALDPLAGAARGETLEFGGSEPRRVRVRSALRREVAHHARAPRARGSWQSASNKRSLPAAITTWPSRVANAAKGAIDGCREPSGPGVSPVA